MNRAPLYPESVYHIYNRANGSELLFAEQINYWFFMERFTKYLDPIAECISYCLMPNHFHFLLRIREIVLAELGVVESKNYSVDRVNLALIKRFGDFFNSYAKAYNKQQGRRGSLFMPSFKRKLVSDKTYLKKLVHYIHRNPVEAGIVKSPESWEFSSYKDIVFGNNRFMLQLDTTAVFDVYENIGDFIECHNKSSPFELADNP